MEQYVGMITNASTEMSMLGLMLVPITIWMVVKGIQVAIMAVKEMMGK